MTDESKLTFFQQQQKKLAENRQKGTRFENEVQLGLHALRGHIESAVMREEGAVEFPAGGLLNNDEAVIAEVCRRATSELGIPPENIDHDADAEFPRTRYIRIRLE